MHLPSWSLCFVLQSTTDDIKVPMAELPPAAGPKARDSTPSRRGTNGQELLPGTPQTAPPPGAVARTNTSAGAQDSLLMSPPPKRATTCFKGPAGALMSPPPARTRSSRSKQATQDGELLHGVCILSQSGYSTTSTCVWYNALCDQRPVPLLYMQSPPVRSHSAQHLAVHHSTSPSSSALPRHQIP